jgi:hypothetical protein
VKNAGEWVQVYPHPPLPIAPVLTATGVGNGISLTWTAGTVAAGSIGSYEVENVPVPYNEATGGTMTTYTSDGRKFARHTFTANGSLNVVKSPNPFYVYLIGGGGGGGKNGFDGGGPHGGGKGGGGGYYIGEAVGVAIGAATITVGAGGSAGTAHAGGPGGDSIALGFTSGGGGYGAWGQDAITGGDGRPGVPAPAANGGNGGGNNHPQTSPCTGKQAALGLATTVGEGGARGAPDGGQASIPGQAGNAGAVVVEYEVA